MMIVQSVSYTTDHCDGDLIPPSFWPTHVGSAGIKKCAEEIIKEVKEDIANHVDFVGDGKIKVEVRKDDVWQAPKYFSKSSDRRLKTIQDGLANMKIDCIRVEIPEFVNGAGVLINSYANVYYMNVVGNPSALDNL